MNNLEYFNILRTTGKLDDNILINEDFNKICNTLGKSEVSVRDIFSIILKIQDNKLSIHNTLSLLMKIVNNYNTSDIERLYIEIENMIQKYLKWDIEIEKLNYMLAVYEQIIIKGIKHKYNLEFVTSNLRAWSKVIQLESANSNTVKLKIKNKTIVLRYDRRRLRYNGDYFSALILSKDSSDLWLEHNEQIVRKDEESAVLDYIRNLGKDKIDFVITALNLKDILTNILIQD